MTSTLLGGYVHVEETFSCGKLSIPFETIVDNDVSAVAGIKASKLEHQHALQYSQKADTDVVAEQRIIHIVKAVGEVCCIDAVLEQVPDDNRTVTIDLRRHRGAVDDTVLVSPIVLDSGNTAWIPESANLNSTNKVLQDNDVLKVTIAIAGDTGSQPQGLGVTVTIREDAGL